jgi:hypothetical protein
MTYLENRN